MGVLRGSDEKVLTLGPMGPLLYVPNGGRAGTGISGIFSLPS